MQTRSYRDRGVRRRGRKGGRRYDRGAYYRFHYIYTYRTLYRLHVRFTCMDICTYYIHFKFFCIVRIYIERYYRECT